MVRLSILIVLAGLIGGMILLAAVLAFVPVASDLAA